MKNISSKNERTIRKVPSAALHDVPAMSSDDLSGEQRAALTRAMSGESLFITGGAGTGKSYVLRQIIEQLKLRENRVIVTAATGLAASQHEEGRTLHSLIAHPEELTVQRSENRLTLVIDEVGMVSAKLLDELEGAAVRSNSAARMGAKQVKESWPKYVQLICVGDFFQIPPIGETDSDVEFACYSSVWSTLDLKQNTIVLSQPHRQTGDTEFVSLLNRLRIGICTRSDVETLNSARDPIDANDNIITHLYCKNENVDAKNTEMLQRALSADRGREYPIVTNEGPKLKRLMKQYVNGGAFRETLRLTVGCVVMVTLNVDTAHGISNGLRGTVQALEANTITIVPLHQKRAPVQISRQRRSWGEAWVEQFPLRYAWAITCHKAQGLTLDKAVVDLSDAFEFGMVYTALSRFRCLEDVVLKQGLHPGVVWAHPKALGYYGMTSEKKEGLPSLEVTAVADVIGLPCVLRGFLYTKPQVPKLNFLRCALDMQSPHGEIPLFNKNRSFHEQQLYEVKVSSFERRRTKENQLPVRDCHKFIAANYEWKEAANTAPTRVDSALVKGPGDVLLNQRIRVSVVGKVRKAELLGSKQLIELDVMGQVLEIIFSPDSCALASLPVTIGQEYTLRNVKCEGCGKPLKLDELSVVLPSVRVKAEQRGRLISVSPEIFALAHDANVFAEVLTCSSDIKGAFISPLPFLSGSAQSVDPLFSKAANKVAKTVAAFFSSVQEAVNQKKTCPDGSELVAPEIPHLRLGEGSSVGSKRYGVGAVLAKTAASELFDCLSKCKELGATKNFSSPVQFILLEIFCRGFGNDMMNDFFAFNMFEAIIRFTSEVSEKHRKSVMGAGLTVQEMTLQELIESFKDAIRDEDWQNWESWSRQTNVGHDLSSVHHIPQDPNHVPVLLVPRTVISMRSAAFRGCISQLRDEANDLFRSKLNDAKPLEKFTNFFKAVENIGCLSSAELSIVVSDREVANRIAQGGNPWENGLFLRDLSLQNGSISCVIGDIDAFRSNPHALRPVVLAFVEADMQDAFNGKGCYPVNAVRDAQSATEVPLSVGVAKEARKPVKLLSNFKQCEEVEMQPPNVEGAATDIGTDQIGILYNRVKDCRLRDSTWFMWAVYRGDGREPPNPAQIIFERLKELPLRGPLALAEQLLRECQPFSNAANESYEALRVCTFNVLNLGYPKAVKDELLIEDVIIKQKLAVVALQEVRCPFSKSGSTAHKFGTAVQAPRQTHTFRVFGAREPTSIGGQPEYPSIVIDERLVEPAGDPNKEDWHGYVTYASLAFNKNDDTFPYPRVPYFWRLREKQKRTTFVVVSVHLTPDSDSLSDANRRKCMRLLTEFVNEKWQNEDVFIIGDFNIYNVRDLQNFLIETGSGFKSLLPDGETTNAERTRPYDHILVRDSERFKNAESAIVIDLVSIIESAIASATSDVRKKTLKALGKPGDTSFSNALSDHCPVYCEYTAWQENRMLVKLA